MDPEEAVNTCRHSVYKKPPSDSHAYIEKFHETFICVLDISKKCYHTTHRDNTFLCKAMS